MKYFFYCYLFFLSVPVFSQADTSTWVRAFPITEYITPLNDSIKIVQVNLPNGVSVREKQIGILKGIYRDKNSDTVTIGIGKCQLIKGTYYYFAISYKANKAQPREGDIIYTMVKKPAVYIGQIVKLASHYIEFTNVYDESLFDRNDVFLQWTKTGEQAVLDSMVNDIQFTGSYFLENNPGMNVKISEGKYSGKMVLQIMKTCNRQDLMDFLDYMVARPRNYAGHQWKIAEIFATWLSGGAPTVMRE